MRVDNNETLGKQRKKKKKEMDVKLDHIILKQINNKKKVFWDF